MDFFKSTKRRKEEKKAKNNNSGISAHSSLKDPSPGNKVDNDVERRRNRREKSPPPEQRTAVRPAIPSITLDRARTYPKRTPPEPDMRRISSGGLIPVRQPSPRAKSPNTKRVGPAGLFPAAHQGSEKDNSASPIISSSKDDSSADININNPNSDFQLQVINCPLDDDSLQPFFLSEDESNCIESNLEFLYRELNDWQTRLLVLQSGVVGSPLVCELIEVDVIDRRGLGISGTSEVAYYEALSYAWGDPALVCSITCNGLLIGIGKELATALQYLRSDATNRYIWCDAICINQRDLAEKADQVKNMLRIFEKADLVIAWLGPPCTSSGRLFHALHLIEKDTPPRLRNLYALRMDLYLALTIHLSSAWFVRTWVRQEVFAAKKLLIQFGLYKMDFETFVEKAHLLEATFASEKVLGLGGPQNILPPTLEVFQQEYQHSGTDRHDFQMKTTLPSYVGHWRDVLYSGALFQVSDERDRVYGALGLLTSVPVKFLARLPAHPESLAADFPIDYTKKVSEVYQDVTKYLINTNNTLEILDMFRTRKILENSDSPTWATNWKRKREETSICHEFQYKRDRFVCLLKQDYAETGKLRLNGLRVAKEFILLDARKEMAHFRHQLRSKYRKSFTLNDLIEANDGTGKLPHSDNVKRRNLEDEILSLPYSFVFTHVEETETTFELKNDAFKTEELHREFKKILIGKNHVFAYVKDFTGHDSLDLGNLHLLVPRTTSLEDIIVAFFGSRCLHVLRPTRIASEFKYVGPVAAIAYGQEEVIQYSSNKVFGSKLILKSWNSGSRHKGETFVLI